jgi:2,3,4,5-tetrahydropyridine-2,6-dicarboxylate N-succinyltransferase
MHKLRSEIERLYAAGSLAVELVGEAREVFREFREALTQGLIRAAEKHDGQWRVNAWVKQGILLGFRLGELEEVSSGALSFVDKDTFPARRFGVEQKVRVVPGGSSVRQGAYVAPGVICMPPMYINWRRAGTGERLAGDC